MNEAVAELIAAAEDMAAEVYEHVDCIPCAVRNARFRLVEAIAVVEKLYNIKETA